MRGAGYAMAMSFGVSVCLFVRLSSVKFVKSFARWQHLAASGGFSYRLRYTCFKLSPSGFIVRRSGNFTWSVIGCSDAMRRVRRCPEHVWKVDGPVSAISVDSSHGHHLQRTNSRHLNSDQHMAGQHSYRVAQKLRPLFDCSYR